MNNNDDLDFRRFLRSTSTALQPEEVLRANPGILFGVSPAAEAALATLQIHSIFDLASSRAFSAAAALTALEQNPTAVEARLNIIASDVAELPPDVSVGELADQPISILRAIDSAAAPSIAEALDVSTVRDLTLWPPYLAARQILNDAFLPELSSDFDPEAPADLLPKSGEYPTERVFYHTLVLDQVNDQTNEELEQVGPIDIAPTLDQSFGFKHLGIGALLTIVQSWYAEGVALGQLLHSTALAPGESTRIAMMDWSRRTKAGTTETISESEQLDNETMHSRSLSEVTKAVANEAQQGFSSTNNTTTAQQSGSSSGGATVNIDPLNTFTLGVFGDDPGVSTSGTSEANSTVTTNGMTFTSSSGRRSLEASTTQKVMDRTQQHANSVRNRRASIIREVSEEEHQTVSTRVVTNYNHMHPLSIMYYEVVQIYRVEVAISDVEKCIFIPMKLIDFTQPVIDKYRLVLIGAAQDRHVYELLTTRYGVVEVMPQTPRITPNRIAEKIMRAENPRTVSRENLFSLVMGVKATTEGQPPPRTDELPAAQEKIKIRPSAVDVLIAKGYDLSQIDYATKLFGRNIVRPDSDSLFLPDDTVIMGLLVVDGVVSAKQAKVRGENALIGIGSDGISFTESLQVSEIESIVLTSGQAEEQIVTLVLQCNYLGVVFPLSIKIRLAGSSQPQDVIHFGSVRASKELVDLLNSNKLRYSQAIYRSLDASSLALLLSPYRYRGKSLVPQIDPTPVTITANYLVFKMHEEETELTAQGANAISEWGQWLKDHGITKSRVETKLIPLSSGGVFAEAILGRYNAAEKLDLTRFWNWQDAPIPLAAPEIAPVELTSRGTTEDLKPGQLGAPVVSIVNPTTLPDPTGIAAVLQAIQNGNMFRDMSGLAATLGLAQAGINAASQGATSAGAQAGLNAATAAQLLSDLAKTAASVMTGSVGGSGVNATGNRPAKNVTEEGARLNYARSLDSNNPSTGSVGGGSRASGGGSGGTSNVSSPQFRGSEERVPLSIERKLFDRQTGGVASNLVDSVAADTSSTTGTGAGQSRDLSASTKHQLNKARQAIPTGPGINIVDISDDVSVSRGRILIANFDVNSWILKDEHFAGLEDIAATLNSSPDALVYLEGRASQTGPEAWNVELSQGRADQVYLHLTSSGVDPNKIIGVFGLGSTDPIIDKPQKEEQLNRSVRLVFQIPLPQPVKKDSPQPKPEGSKNWAVRLVLAGSIDFEGVAGAGAIAELKNLETDEVKQCTYLAIGGGVGLKTPEVEHPLLGEWHEFETDTKYTFDDFDNSLAKLLIGGGGALIIGYSIAFLSFPFLGIENIYVGGFNMGSVGADVSGTLGWWNVLGN